MWQRCLTAIVGIPLLFSLSTLEAFLFIAVGILSILGMHEFFKILIPYDIGIMRYYAYFLRYSLASSSIFSGRI